MWISSNEAGVGGRSVGLKKMLVAAWIVKTWGLGPSRRKILSSAVVVFSSTVRLRENKENRLSTCGY